jgi:hypothetical protein
VHAGLAIDLQLGDTAFDRAFIVEGAPSDVVRALLTSPLRESLLSMIRPRLLNDGGELTIADGKVVLAARGWLEERKQAEAFLDLALAVAERVPLAFEEVDAQLRKEAGGAYREQHDAAVARTAVAARTEELQRLAQLRAARPAAHNRRSRLFLYAFVGIFVLVFVMGVLTRACTTVVPQ